MRDRYEALIERVITATLKGQIRAKEQVYQMIQEDLEPGTEELFDTCLQERLEAVQQVLDTESDELKQAKATRQQRALKTLASEWERWKKDNQASSALSGVVFKVTSTAGVERLSQLLAAIDPNQATPLTRDQVKALIPVLRQAGGSEDSAPSLKDLAAGLQQGLTTWQRLETEVIGWIYEQSRGTLGFGQTIEQRGPWPHWAKKVGDSALQAVFEDLARHQTITDEGVPSPWALPDWLEMAWVLQRLQLALVSWFDQQPYDPRAGKRLSIATFLTFAVVWSQLARRFQQLGQSQLAQGAFQMNLQGLYQFAQQDYFPLYGGLFAALSGESLQTLLDYLDQPLRQVPNTQAKARILTLLGYSQRALGRPGRALAFHQAALESARTVGDRRCEIANLNHLSRTQVAQEDYDAATEASQRALILARQTGDRLGEANALANLGYSELFKAQQSLPDPDQYEPILNYLEQGLALSERVGDRPSEAICANSLGIGRVKLGQYADAVTALQRGLQIAQAIGDLSLQGLNYAYLGEAYRGIDNTELAVVNGCLGMYLLHQIASDQWRQPARVLSILYGQLGPEAFQSILGQYRPQIAQQIGVDGYDYLPKLLLEYRQSLE